MANYSDQLITMQSQVSSEIKEKVLKLGNRSKFICERTIKIKDEALAFDLNIGLPLSEVSCDSLIDSEGNVYNFDVLPIDNLVELVEYINEL